jgi:ABC-type glycerol-3-phosphate transport system substrate-binding protein
MTRRLRRGWLLTLALATTAATVAACSSGSTNSSTATGASAAPFNTALPTSKTTLRLLGSEEPSTFAPVIAGFEKLHPNIRVQYTALPFGTYDSAIEARLGSGDTSFDVYEVDQPTVSALAARKWLVNLDMLKADAQRVLLPEQYEVSTYQGSLYSLPMWTSDQFLFYNKKLLNKAGDALPGIAPGDSWTWQQTAAAARKAQQAGAEYGLLFEQQGAYYQLEPLPVSDGGGTGVLGPNNLSLDVTDPGWIKAMTWYRSLFADGISPRGVDDETYDADFQAGKVPFLVAGPWDITTFAATKGLSWGMAPQPYFQGGKQVTPTDSQSLGLNPNSPNKAAGLAFMRYATLTTAGSEALYANDFLPPSEKVANAAFMAKVNKVDPPVTTGAAALISYDQSHTAVPRPRTVGYLEFLNFIDQAFADIADGANPRSALTQAQQETLRAWAQLK